MNSSPDPHLDDADAHLASGERAMLSGVVTSVIEAEKAIAALQALKVQLLASGASLAHEQIGRVTSQLSREREMPMRAIAAEFAAALRRSDRAVQHQLDESLTIATRFAATLDALGTGRIELAHVRIIADAGAAIDDDLRRGAFEQAALSVAERESAGRSKPIIALLAERFHPLPFEERHLAAAATRRVWVKDLEGGMAELTAILPAELAYAVLDRLSRYARAMIGRRPSKAADASDATVEGASEVLDAAGAEETSDAAGPEETSDAAGPSETSDAAGPRSRADEAAGHDLAGATSEPGGAPPLGHAMGDPTDETADRDAADQAADPACDNSPADVRTTDQVRADVFADLLLTGHATAEDSAASVPEDGAIVAHVQVTVPAEALTAADGNDGRRDGAARGECTSRREPAVLGGYGPVSDAFARRVAGAAPGWDRLFIEPTTGLVVTVDRYRPAEEQCRLLRARDEHCRFPGCRMPVRRCDLDHTRDAAHGGPTSVCNLAHLCRRHHTLKHHSAWTVEQDSGGVLIWTSPLGRVYRDLPARTVAFRPEPPPPF